MIFHSIYVQPINEIIAIMFIALIVWTIVGLCIQRQLLWRVINSALALVSAIGILYFTIVDRTSSGAHSMPFIRTIEHIHAQPELIREIIMNAFLFFPFGLTMPYALESLPRVKNMRSVKITVLSTLVLSGCVELTQRVFNFGSAELSDIVMNTAGATIGSLSYIVRCKLTR